ncbi:polysaccharide deacetylase family protein [Streptomyces sp. TS71-3]|uniref:polysaccharide deacetylase family protein n=1 Tax=Streptomyces sp. TS71-3 TaxID=2733862 RepID=UPI001B12AB33|nr:polysaccharide deacetylase family protein [Streptomyces sp. TS71-3]GHJ42345.1 hypothetical protein Sm713_79540 [Streptomyces sp. TS71-3]
MNTRRWFLAGALGVGAAAATGTAVVLTGSTDHPASGSRAGASGSASTTAKAARKEAAEAATRARTRRPSSAPRPGPVPVGAARRQAYRLRPIAGDSALGTPAFHPQVRTQAELTLPGRARAVALTFDDGPDPDFTPKVLAVLRTYRVQATFFVVGENAKAFPRLLHDIAAGGHVVANHSYTHPLLTSLSLGKVKDELGRTSDVIERVLDAPPRWCRAPYGEWDKPSLRVCAGLGMEPIGWSIDTNDWALPGIDSIERAVTRAIEPGSIILQHDGGGDRSQTVEAVSEYLPRLLDKGYEFVRPHV